MLPDFKRPAFGFTALCTVRFLVRPDGVQRLVRSDYRCQLRYSDGSADDVEARVFFVGQEAASSTEEAPVVLAFLDGEAQRRRCKVGTRFELREDKLVVAYGSVQALAIR